MRKVQKDRNLYKLVYRYRVSIGRYLHDVPYRRLAPEERDRIVIQAINNTPPQNLEVKLAPHGNGLRWAYKEKL